VPSDFWFTWTSAPRPLVANLFDESSQVAGINAFLGSFHLISRKDISGCLTISLPYRPYADPPDIALHHRPHCYVSSGFGRVDFVSANATDFCARRGVRSSEWPASSPCHVPRCEGCILWRSTAGFAEENDPIKALLYDAVSASFCVEGLSFAGLAAATKEKASAPSWDTSPTNRTSTDVKIGIDVQNQTPSPAKTRAASRQPLVGAKSQLLHAKGDITIA
jgi:hypothetical protein